MPTKKSAKAAKTTPKKTAQPATIDDDTLPRAMGTPARNALAAVGVTTVSQAMRLRTIELLAIHGVGPKAVAVLAAALAERGLSLRP